MNWTESFTQLTELEHMKLSVLNVMKWTTESFWADSLKCIVQMDRFMESNHYSLRVCMICTHRKLHQGPLLSNSELFIPIYLKKSLITVQLKHTNVHIKPIYMKSLFVNLYSTIQIVLHCDIIFMNIKHFERWNMTYTVFVRWTQNL